MCPSIRHWQYHRWT